MDSLDNESWYVAKLIVQCKVEGDESGLWTVDEQIRVIRASDPDTAYRKTMDLGKRQETSYENMYGKIVTWEYIGLQDLAPLLAASIVDGTEITGRLLTSDNPLELVRDDRDLQVNWIERNRHRTAADILQQPDLE
jgi:hypothetical protein